MGRLLPRIHAAVLEALTTKQASAELVGRINPKGDAARAFDLVAEECVQTLLERQLPEALLLSEESAELALGALPAKIRVILDPVDGSDNYRRNLNMSAVCVAVLPVDGPLAVQKVEWALVGDLDHTVPQLACRGRGAYLGETRLRTSGVERIEDAFISFELNKFAPPPQVSLIMQRAQSVRCFGCASRALSWVASGAMDAHVDIRRRLTPESFYAAALLVEEAGGCVLDPHGQQLLPAENLTDRFSLIVAATRALADDIVEALQSR